MNTTFGVLNLNFSTAVFLIALGSLSLLALVLTVLIYFRSKTLSGRVRDDVVLWDIIKTKQLIPWVGVRTISFTSMLGRFVKTTRLTACVIYIVLIAVGTCISWISFHDLSISSDDPVDQIGITIISEADTAELTGIVINYDTARIYARPGTKIDIVSSWMHSCIAQGKAKVEQLDPVYNFYNGIPSADFYSVEFDPAQYPGQGDEVHCVFDSGTMRRNFTSRAMRVEFRLSDEQAKITPDLRLSVFLDATGATEVSSLGGIAVDTNNWTLADKGIIELRWVDETRRNQRELIMLVVGGLLGVVGAALLELLKLFISAD